MPALGTIVVSIDSLLNIAFQNPTNAYKRTDLEGGWSLD
jgi:hypothetical protein